MAPLAERKLSPKVSSWNMYEMITGCWKSENNKVNADFWLFSTEAELLAGDWHPAWLALDVKVILIPRCIFHS